MEKYDELGAEEMLEWAKINGMNLSEGQAKELINDESSDINLDEWFKANDINPIGEYENLSKKMKAKIKEIIDSLKEEKKKELEQKVEDSESDDRDEDDTLDEKEGKEELDEDKKKQVKEREEGTEESAEEPEERQEEKTDENKEEEQKEDTTPQKDEYLAKVQKLHEMKIVDYKDQLRKDNPKMDRYFIKMIYLQRELSRTRNAFIKEYGDEELVALENRYLREELKYQKTLDLRMEKDLSKLRKLDEKLDSILERMHELQKNLERGIIDLEEYNDAINKFESDKLDTLWQINRLNPSLLEEKQERIETRDEYEKRTVTRDVQKEKSMDPELKSKQKSLDYMEKKQEGVAEDVHKDMQVTIEKDIDEKEKRLDALRNELSGIDIETPDGKKRAFEIIGEIQTLESQKASQEKQKENLEKNMDAGVKSYGDLEDPELNRNDDTEKFMEFTEEINPDEVSNDLMAQLKNAAMHDPETPEQAEEYLDNISEATEDISERSEIEQEDDNVPTLFNRKKRPY